MMLIRGGTLYAALYKQEKQATPGFYAAQIDDSFICRSSFIIRFRGG